MEGGIPSEGAFSNGPNLPSKRSSAAAAPLPDGRILIAGGYNGNYLSTSVIFNPQSNQFSNGPNIPSKRSYAAAAPSTDGWSPPG